MSDDLMPVTLADVEGRIEQLQRSIRDLRETGIRMDEARRMPGAAARKWLMDRGASNLEATQTIMAVLQERQGGRRRGDRDV